MAGSAGAVVWNWRGEGGERARKRALARLRRQGLLQATLLIGMAAIVKYGLHRRWPGDVLFLVGVVVLLAALWRPRWLRPLHRFGRAVGHGAGVALTWLLLVPFFALCVVPAGLVLRLRGRDPLQRAPLAPGLTGWIPRRHEPTSASLARQFLDEDRAARSLQRPVGSPSARAWPAATIANAGDGERA